MASDIAAVKLSEKGLKMMGISTDQLIDSFLKDERGSLSDETWSIFWAGLKQKKRAMDVITKLTDYFLKAIDGEFKTKLSTQSLLNTIIFLALWFKLDKSESMKRLIISWKQKLNSPEMRKINGSEKVLRLLQIRTENKEDLLEVLVSWVFKMHSKDRFQYIKTSEILTFDGEHFPDGESSSIYVFIKLMCKDKGIFTKVLNQLIVHTSVYGNKNNDFSEEEIEDSILAMLHIFRSLLSYWRAPSSNLLQDAIGALQPFFFRPSPLSRVTKSVLVRLKNEILAPGNSILERFAAESRIPQLSDYVEDDIDAFQRSRPLFYVIDIASKNSPSWFAQLNLRSAIPYIHHSNSGDKTMGNFISPEIKALLFLHLIMDDSGLTPDEAEEIRLLTPDEASRMFENTVLLLQQCMEMKITEAKEFRRKSFVNLKKEFLEMAAANENKEIPELALPDELPVDYLPPVSPIAHLAIQDNNGDISSSAYTFPTPMDQERLGFTPYPKTPVFDSLLAILKMYSGTADEDDPLEVRICLAGDNTLIHRFVCAYMSIVTEHSNLLSGIILRIFVVPLQKSLVASYIARFDSWYNRHIYVPFSEGNVLLPWLGISKSMVAEPPAEKLLMPPVLFLRDNIENYVREALHFLPIRIYKVEAWFDEKGITTNQIGESFVRLPDIVIPLVGSLEIGLIAEKMYFIQKMSPGDEDKEDYSEPKLLGILKDFRFTSHDLKIDYVKVDLSGRTYDSAQYSSDLILPCSRVTLANLPMKNAQHRDYPNPRDASLEMIVRVAESKKQKSGKLMSSQDPSHHVSSVHVSAPRPEGKFRIMVDGVLFGPFYTISVSPIEVDGRHMSLPVSTFFPIQGM